MTEIQYKNSCVLVLQPYSASVVIYCFWPVGFVCLFACLFAWSNGQGHS